MVNKKSNRTQVKDIAAETQELTTAEAGKVKGGAATPTPTPTPTTPTPTTTTTTTSSTATARAGYDLKQNKAV